MRVIIQPSADFTGLVERLTVAIVRLAVAIENVAEAQRAITSAGTAGGRPLTIARSSAQSLSRCNHSEGHEIRLSANDALAIETSRECPCCSARLWIRVPSVGAILDFCTSTGCNVPDLDVALTRRERQVLNVLHHSPYPLRNQQLATLVWSDPDRTHEVRSTLYRLRRKLLNSGWGIPLPQKGKGVRLMPDITGEAQRTSQLVQRDAAETSDLLLDDPA